MTNFELEDRYLALRVLDNWVQPLFSDAMLPKTINKYRFALKCKTRGLIAHDRVLTGRIA